MDSTQIEHEDALDSGIVEVGTYQDPLHRKRTPVKGHVRMAKPEPAWRDKDEAELARSMMLKSRSLLEGNDAGMVGLIDPSDPPIPRPSGGILSGLFDEDGDLVDLNTNGTALDDFFGVEGLDSSDFDEPVDSPDDFVFAGSDGTVPKAPQAGSSNAASKRSSQTRNTVKHRRLVSIHHPSLTSSLEERGIIDFFKGFIRGYCQTFQGNVYLYTCSYSHPPKP